MTTPAPRRLARLGIDRSIAVTLLNRGWVALAGPVSLFFIIKSLSPLEQGFYFTISSILGLQVFFELGLGFVVLQTVSHLGAHLHVQDGLVVGPDEAKGKLGRLLADVLRIYSAISGAFILVLLAGGAWFLSRGDHQGAVAWQTAWLVLVPLFGVTIVFNVVFNYLEGLGLIQDIALARLTQSLIGLSGLWLALTLDMKLMSLAIMHATNFGVGLAWIFWRHGRKLRDLLRQRAPAGTIRWKQDIWPFQWRIAISWVAGYLGSLAITPIVFSQLGAIEAGRIGLSLTLMGAITAGALAWITTKSAIFGQMAARGQYTTLASLYGGAQKRAVAAALLATSAAVLLLAGASHLLPSLSARFVSIGALAVLATAHVFNVQISGRAIYLRSFRKEPFAWMSVTNGVAVTSLTLLLAHISTIDGVSLGYLAVTASIALFWSRPLFKRCQLEYTRLPT